MHRPHLPRPLFILALTLLASLAVGPRCYLQPIRSVQPSRDAVVTAASFPIEVELDPSADPATLDVRLNGVAIAMNGSMPTLHASVEPGALLRDRNWLVVRVRTLGGIQSLRGHYFDYRPPKARAFRIEDPADCPTGPQAHCRPGDWMLANAHARFVIQDAPKKDMWSIGGFGGNLIDAERVVDGVPQGRDNFLELQPTVNIETVINAQSVEIVNDGADGGPAVVRSCGPDDLLDFVNPSTSLRDYGFTPIAYADDIDHEVTGCTEYALGADDAALELTTTMFNGEDADLGLFVGDWINANGEVESWPVTAPSPVFQGKPLVTGGGVGEPLTGSLEAYEFIGFGEAEGVNYSYVPIDLVPRFFSHDFFSASGVSLVMFNSSIVFTIFVNLPPQFVVPALGEKSFTRHFAVTTGSDGGAVTLQAELSGRAAGTLSGCVTLGGVPAPGARVGVLRVDATSKPLDLAAHFVTDAEGCYSGRIPVGSYRVAAARKGAPYDSGTTTPLLHAVEITNGGVAVKDLALPATGRLRARVMDAASLPMPGRVSVVGFDPSPDFTIADAGQQAELIGASITGVFDARGRDDLPFGIARIGYAGADGVAEFDLEPGSYQVYLSRGFEYSLHSEPVSVSAGATTEVSGRLAQVVDSSGLVSSDFHVHALNSADSGVSHFDRIHQFAGEGVDNIVITDHNVRTDLNPDIQEFGLAEFVHATTGEEITTWDYGHFNGYPYTVDPSRPSGGSLDWGFQAPPGEGFPAYGNYILTPAQLDAKGTTGPGTTPESVVQINHISSTYGPLKIDTAQVPPQSNVTPDELLAMRLDPESGNLFHPFRAMEIVNGANTGSLNVFLNQHMGIWFNLLNQGIHVTGTGVSDTHGYQELSVPGARTWTASPTDAPSAIDSQHVGAAIKTGRASVGMGALLRTRLLAADATGAVANLAWGGSTQVTSTNGTLDLEISVQSPAWAPYDRIEIYANAATQSTGSVGEVPVFYTATPTRVLEAGSDFTVLSTLVDANVPGATRLETLHVERFEGLAQDTWFVVVVRGTNGVSRPMFPVAPHELARDSNTTLAGLIDGNLGEGGTRAFAISNPLYGDVDGNPGFQPLFQSPR